jgi:methyltransferase (TIGR00027 family)
MSSIKDVTGTAFVVAEFRARENAEPHPLYVDRIVPIFLDERTRQAADRIATGFPAAEKNVRLRTRYLDDRLDEQLANGCRQVVILGAGLDTRAVRKRSPGVAYFEIDDPNTVSFKQARLMERGIDAPIDFIAGDYVERGVLPLLEGNGFRCDFPSFFIWEGNTMYLTKEAAIKVLRDLSARAPVQHLVRLHGRGGGRADDRRASGHGLRGALRGHGCALALRHRRSRSFRRGDRLDRR